MKFAGKIFKFFVLLLLIDFSVANAAVIKKLRKKRGVVIIDEGRQDGIKKGERICFYGPRGKKVACGKVVRLKKMRSYVKLKKKKRIRKLRKNYSTIRPVKNLSVDYAKDDENTEIKSSSTGIGTNVKLSYILTLFPQHKVQNPGTSPEKVNEKQYWKPADKIGFVQTIQPGGGGLEFEFNVTESMSLSIGGRAKILNPAPVEDFSFVNTQNDHYITTSQTDGFTAGGWADLYFLTLGLSNTSGIKVGIGAEIDYLTANMIATEFKDGTAEPVAEILKANLTGMAASVRLPIEFYYMFSKSIGVGMKFVPMYTPTVFGISPTGESLITSVNSDDLLSSYYTATGIGTTGFSFEITPISFIFSF